MVRLSPGVYVREKDLSDYTPSIANNVVAVFGFASQGKPNEATLITNQAALLNTFGDPDSVVPSDGIKAALEILEETSQLYYVRCITSSGADASASVELGAQPYVSLATSAFGNGGSYSRFVFGNLKNSAGTIAPVDYEFSMASSVTSATAASSIEGNINRLFGDSGQVAYYKDGTGATEQVYFVDKYSGSSAQIDVSAYSGATASPTTLWTGASGNLIGHGYAGNSNHDGSGWASSVGATFNRTSASGGVYMVRSMYNGSGYNYRTVTPQNSPSRAAGLQIKPVAQSKGKTNLEVWKDGGRDESFYVELASPVSGDIYNPEVVINTGTDNAVSQWIKAQFEAEGSEDPTWTVPAAWGTAISNVYVTNAAGAGTGESVKFAKIVDGTYNLINGNNGDADVDSDGNAELSDAAVTAALIGNRALKTGIYAIDLESLDNILLTLIPGITTQSVQNEMISFAEETENFLYLVTPPQGLNSEAQAIEWHNGNYTGRTVALNTSYGAVAWPWLKVFNPWTGLDEWVDPAVFAAKTICYTANTGEVWYAPAGLVYGKLTKPTDVEVKLGQAQRDALYQAGNNINPVTKFVRDGIVLWGQKTLKRTASKTDRINVRLLLIQIKKALKAANRTLVFQPNDPITWQRVKDIVNPYLDDLMTRRAIRPGYKVICDATTNTPLRVNRGELWCKLIIEPITAAEIIEFEINIT